MNEKTKLTDLQKVRRKHLADRKRRKELLADLRNAKIKARTVYLSPEERPLFDEAIAHLGAHIKGPTTAARAHKKRSLPTEACSQSPVAITCDTSRVSMAAADPTGRGGNGTPCSGSSSELVPLSTASESRATSEPDVPEKGVTAETRPVASCDADMHSSEDLREASADSDQSRLKSAAPHKVQGAPEPMELDFGSTDWKARRAQ
jgi:hypothetical protein